MSFDHTDGNEIPDFQLSDALGDISPIITVLDTKGLVLYVNRVAAGVDITKFIGSNVHSWVKEKTSQLIKKSIEEVLSTKLEVTYEVDYIDPTGLEHFFSNSMIPLIRSGDVYGVTIITYEVTELKIIKSQLERSQDIATLSLDNLAIGVWDLDILNRTLRWDDMSYEIYGWDKEDFDNTFDCFYNNVIHPEDLEKFKLESLYALKNEMAQEGEFRFIRHNDKQIRWASFKSKFFVDDKNVVIRSLGVTWDNTAYKLSEETKQRNLDLEKQNNELKEFAYLASHDLKAPLRTLKSYSDLLSSRYKDRLDDKANMYLQFISEAALEMDNQIKELLNYSLVGQHKDMEMVDCNKLVDKILEKLSFMINAKGSKIEVGNLPTIFAYSMDISLLFQNLISNAVKFHNKERQSFINISAEQVGDSWQFEVKDNGIGIKAKYLKKIFSIFERLHTKEEFEGTGIGLAHCRKIVELHGGNIWARSVLGKGSSFLFTIKQVIDPVSVEN